MSQDNKAAAKAMIERQLIPRGISSQQVLQAMESVPRHIFVPEHLLKHAYDDSPLPIGAGQTISQPYIVAYMTEKLDIAQGHKVLEIGTGSGYQTAILAHLKCRVYTIELHKELLDNANKVFQDLNLTDIQAKNGNGYEGWEDEAPFDRILITAAPPQIPQQLTKQMRDNSKMIVPVGEANEVQMLKLITKQDDEIYEETLLPVRFVPMVSKPVN